MKKTLLVSSILVLAGLSACKQGQLKFKDVNAKDKHIYGDIDGPARQLKNTYPAATEKTTETATKFRTQVEQGLMK